MPDAAEMWSFFRCRPCGWEFAVPGRMDAYTCAFCQALLTARRATVSQKKDLRSPKKQGTRKKTIDI